MNEDELVAMGFEFIGGSIIHNRVVRGRCLPEGPVWLDDEGEAIVARLSTPTKSKKVRAQPAAKDASLSDDLFGMDPVGS